MPDRTPLYVLGLGLIGGSLVRAAEDREVTGWSPTDSTRAAAAADGFRVVDSAEKLLVEAQNNDGLVVLAAPIPAFAELLALVERHAPTVRLTDVASVKGAVEDLVLEHAPEARYIGSHPMTGTQHSGWAAGSAELFRGAPWVTTLSEDSDLDTWIRVASLAVQVGSRVVPAEAAAHDDAVARISHLPHLLALALAQVGAAGGALPLSLAAGSFADGTRVAATRPDLIRAMTETNRNALVDALDSALGLLGVARGSLASTGSLMKIAEGGHAAREQYEQRSAGLEPLVLTGDDMIEQLLSVGASGGYVTEVETAEDGLRVSAWFPED